MAILLPPPADYTPELPKGAVRYESETHTQKVFVLSERDVIQRVRIRDLLDRRWHQPGGLEGVTGWTSERYRTLPDGVGVRVWVGDLVVKNGLGYRQPNKAILRIYPEGTRFDEILRNSETKKIFEHRSRILKSSGWESRVEYAGSAARPRGYSGLKVSCASCHREAGTGGYAEGLVPGGDTVLGDPMPWQLIPGK
jgi:hypothetical protein